MFKWIIGLLVGSCSVMLVPTLASEALLPRALLVASIAGSILMLFLAHSKRVKRSLFRSCLLLFSGCLFGFGWSLCHASWRIAQQIQSPDNNSVHIIEAEVVSLPAIYPEYCQFRVRVNQSESKVLSDSSLWLKDYTESCLYKLGQRWWLEVKLKPIHGPINQAGFDYEFYAFEQGLDGKGYIRDARLLEESSWLSISSIRQKLYTDLARYQNSGVLQALLIGEKSAIQPDDKELLRQLGLSHLIAISGLHISIIAGLFFLVFYQVVAWLNVIAKRNVLEPYRMALVISCIAALAYSALADFSIPTVRALLMWCSVAFMVILKRQNALLSGLKYALLIILLVAPLTVISAGFWMSFIAVTVISLLLVGRIALKNSWQERCKQLLKLQFAITIILAIPSLMVFQEASLAGIVVNTIVIPLFSLIILPLIIISTLLQYFFNVHWPLQQIDFFITGFIETAKELQSYYEFLNLEVYIPSWMLVAFFAVSLLILLPLSKLRKPFIALAMAFLLSATLKTSNNQPQAIVFDVGHGLAVLLTDGKYHVLFDTGYGAAGSSAFDNFIYPSFKQLGINELDALVLSHKDNDHAGGATKIINTIPVNQVIAGRWAQSKYNNPGFALCQAGYEFQHGSFQFKVLHPSSNFNQQERSGTNDDSCVIHVSSTTDKEFSLLLTGDVGKDVEYQLAETLGDALQADVLLAPHHGSNSSSTYPFLKMVNPDLTIYSTERYSRYQLPNRHVVERYNDFGIQQLHSGCLGQITIDLTTLNYHYERQKRHLWRNLACPANSLGQSK